MVLVVEDNLTKGASGQAVQCMNLLFGLPEDNRLDPGAGAALSEAGMPTPATGTASAEVGAYPADNAAQ